MGEEGLGLKVWAFGPVSALGWDLDAASHPADPASRGWFGLGEEGGAWGRSVSPLPLQCSSREQGGFKTSSNHFGQELTIFP